LFVHYGDLTADPRAEIRRIAAFCDLTVDDDAWPAILAATGLDAMRNEARGADDPLSTVFEGGADRFFFTGRPDRWRDVLTNDDLALYETAAAHLDPTLRTWLERGRHAVGM
jgi:aryl sulfotransferase